MITKALWLMYKKCKKNAVAYTVMALSFVAVAIFDVSVLYVIIGCALFGLVSSYIIKRRSKK